jgi:hypothetical protein
MVKYYFLLALVAAGFLVYVFLQDPCNQTLRADFSEKHPGYKILDSSAVEGSPESVSCHIYYKKPDSQQVYEDVWLYVKPDGEWQFSRILESGKKKQTS